MFLVSMIGWWYGRGFGWIIGRLGPELKVVNSFFAVDVLLKTWFAPWKQITTTAGSYTFVQKLVDKTISRLIGFLIRTFMLIFAALWATVILIFGFVSIVLWPFIPLGIVILPILFISGVAL